MWTIHDSQPANESHCHWVGQTAAAFGWSRHWSVASPVSMRRPAARRTHWTFDAKTVRCDFFDINWDNKHVVSVVNFLKCVVTKVNVLGSKIVHIFSVEGALSHSSVTDASSAFPMAPEVCRRCLTCRMDHTVLPATRNRQTRPCLIWEEGQTFAYYCRNLPGGEAGAKLYRLVNRGTFVWTIALGYLAVPRLGVDPGTFWSPVWPVSLALHHQTTKK